jgi:type I restriction enzyme S subunit
LQNKNISYQFHLSANGVTRYGLSHNSIKNIRIIVPPIPEQHQIARYLDWKTTQISKFIKAKKLLIELLKEQKQVIINDAVTGKIDVPTGKHYPKYKDSGVEWLGMVPEEWEVRRLRTIANVQASGVDKNSFPEEIPVKLCNYIDVYKNNRITDKLNFMHATVTANEKNDFFLKKDDVIITKDSESWKDIAVPAYVPEELPNIVCAYHLSMIRSIKNKITGEYLFNSFSSELISYQFRISANGVTRFGLSQGAIKNGIFPVPSIPEQLEICKYITSSSQNIDQIIERTNQEISFLQEYRTRLISDVVTGKVDVRDVVVPETADDISDAIDASVEEVYSEEPDEQSVNE